jgi:integrase
MKERDHITKLKTGAYQVSYRKGGVPHVLDPRPTKAAKGLLVQPRTTFSGKTAKQDAYDFDDYVQREKQNVDLSMTPAQKIEYKSCQAELEKKGITDITILEIVQNHVKNRPKVVSNKLVSEVIEEFISEYQKDAENNHGSYKTSKGYKTLRADLEPFLMMKIGELQQPEVAKRIARHIRKRGREHKPKPWKPTTLHNHFIKVKSFLNTCVDHGYLSSQPLTKIDVEVKGKGNDEELRILTPDEAQKVMYAAQETDKELGLLPFFILHVFCGIRPIEATRLTWDNVKIDTAKPFVQIPPKAIARKKEPRKIQLEKYPAIIEWFKICDRSRPLFGFELVDGDINRTFYDKREKVMIAAGLYAEGDGEEPRSIFNDFGRHSCATYLYEAGASMSAITKRLGNSKPVLWDHYISSSKTEEEAHEYFAIMPMNDDEKMVQFG